MPGQFNESIEVVSTELMWGQFSESIEVMSGQFNESKMICEIS
jgi:hypothetical protein